MNFFQNPIYQILHPESIAVFGASNNVTSMGTHLLLNIIDLGFRGTIYPIHPKQKKVLGIPAYPNVKKIPFGADLALIVVSREKVPKVLEECGQRGIRRAIIVSGGFRELGDYGRDLEREINSIAKKYKIRFIGPNCIGVINAHHCLNTTFFPYRGKTGFLGMVSQSGSFITQIFDCIDRLGMGFSQGISVGNEANIDLVDCIEYLGDCEDTKVIALYIEEIKRGREFLRVCKKVSSKKPIVAYYVGGSEAGKKACLSHTGSLSGSDAIYNGVFKQSGVIRVYSIEGLFDCCASLGTQPLLRGKNLAILSTSGGPGTAAADSCGRLNLNVPNLSPRTKNALRPFVPRTGSLVNPVDLTFIKELSSFFKGIPQILLDDKGIDGLLIYFLRPKSGLSEFIENTGNNATINELEGAEDIREHCRNLAMLARESGKPALGSMFSGREEPIVEELQDNGFPVFPSPERSARAMWALCEYTRMRGESDG
ncbi:MAG: hypothetical protein B1H11_09835 [Desulfobacteraceae bacterium 4484_190.1]|nr:MAG: hypothetical protein B1H11_09835 [Desulfobacteraceae bacterium 4484_190.1]